MMIMLAIAITISFRFFYFIKDKYKFKSVGMWLNVRPYPVNVFFMFENWRRRKSLKPNADELQSAPKGYATEKIDPGFEKDIAIGEFIDHYINTENSTIDIRVKYKPYYLIGYCLAEFT
ncbi:hypothetical protein FOXB_01268 [Fusarium oxysporum f. sp. conglutinans Fo5176]|uniref:Uncharacterized protein n=1 Tax=Fusarium oxysporum (strain Fo5176) TaxID=660025 RepID=F9F4E3_FUSOF|nr:hypothetical protein FOXB_01268 [Fusarium oxysporum f. sp. conglutinans Fo5176]